MMYLNNSSIHRLVKCLQLYCLVMHIIAFKDTSIPKKGKIISPQGYNFYISAMNCNEYM